MNALGRASRANRTSADARIALMDLLPKIVDITERLDVFSWGLQNYYTDVYLTTDSSRSLEQINYKNRKYRALMDIEELQNEIENFRKRFGENSEEINNASKKLDAAVDAFNNACALVDGTYIVQAASRDLKSLKYMEAVTKLKNLHKKIDKMDCTGDLAIARSNFRAISETQLTVSQAQLSVEWSNLFRWSLNKTVDTLKLCLSVQQNDLLLLQNVLKALFIADQIMIDLQEFSDFFILDLLPNIIKYNCEIFIEDRLGALVFIIKINLTETSNPSIPTIINNLMAVFEFLETTMGSKLEPEKKLFECFGDSNREEFFSRIIQDCIKGNLPSCEISYQAYKEIVSELATFNKFLINLKYVKEAESPLKKYIDDTDLLLYDTKCNKMLAEARQLMRESLTQATVTVGAVPDSPDASILDVTKRRFKYNLNTPLFFPKCVVSLSVKKIAELITKYLEESANLPMEYGYQLVLYIKDIAVMYESIVTERNSVRLKKNSLEIGLFFNNCNYLAHAMVGPPWKTVLPKQLADHLNSTLMSHVYDLRIVGMEKLSIYLKETKDMFSSKINGDSFTSPNEEIEDKDELFEIFNENVNYVIGFLIELKDNWLGYLPGRMYELSMCTLVCAITEAMTSCLLCKFDHLSDTHANMLAHLFQYAVDEIRTIFYKPIKLEIKIHGWIKFTYIPQLFDGHLTEISDMWNEDHLLKRHYKCEEVRSIIRMRFPDTPYRLQVLKEIQ